MESSRREFFKQLTLIAASVAVLPRAFGAAGTAMATATSDGTYKVFYTFTAPTKAEAEAFCELIKSCGVRSHNTELKTQGHIISRTPFYELADGSMRSEVVFKSKESYHLFLESSKSVSADFLEFRNKHNIKTRLEPA